MRFSRRRRRPSRGARDGGEAAEALRVELEEEQVAARGTLIDDRGAAAVLLREGNEREELKDWDRRVCPAEASDDGSL